MTNPYLQTFGTEEGRKVLADLRVRFGWTEASTFSPVPGMMEFREGGRQVIMFIEKACRRGPDADPTAEGPANAEL